MKVKLSCSAIAALSLIAGQALAQDAAAPAPVAAPAAEQTAPAQPVAPAPAAPIADVAPVAPAAETAPSTTDASPVVSAPSTETTLGKPAAGKGQIVFYRQSKFVGAAVGFKVREGEVELGKLNNGNFFFIDVEPGAHEYVVHSEVKDVLPLEVDAGEVYYVQGTLGMGIMVGRPNLSPSDKGKFEAAGKMKQSKLKS